MFLYFTIQVSKFGNVGIYDEKFRLQRQYEIDIDTDPNEDFDVAASDPGWVKELFSGNVLPVSVAHECKK